MVRPHKLLVWILALSLGYSVAVSLLAQKAPGPSGKPAPAQDDKANAPEAKKMMESGAGMDLMKKDMPRGTFEFDRPKRDPFKSLVIKKSTEAIVESPEMAKRPSGVQGMSISDLKLIGIAKGISGEKIAIIMGTDQKAHFMSAGDRVWDGIIQSVDDSMVVFVQEPKGKKGAAVRRQEIKVYLYPPVQQRS